MKNDDQNPKIPPIISMESESFYLLIKQVVERLKNENKTVPLSAQEATGVLFAGPYVDTRALCGAWSFPATYDNIKTVQGK